MSTNTNVPSVTLQTAILMEVKEFSQNNTQFSVFDITRKLRDKTSKGTLEIPEVEVNGSALRYNIPHTAVKQLFDEMWQNGAFDPYLTLTRSFNGTYFQYTPTPVNNQPAPQPTQNSAVVSSTPAKPQVTVSSVPPKTITKDVVIDRINRYLKYCQSVSFQPTMKQIQSSIKCNGWTCLDIFSVVSTDLKANTTRTGYISKSKVIIP